jgi:hypothetical protein
MEKHMPAQSKHFPKVPAEPHTVVGWMDKEQTDPNEPTGGFTVRWAGPGWGGVDFRMDGDLIVMDSEMSDDAFVKDLLERLVDLAVRDWRSVDHLATVGDSLDALETQRIRPEKLRGKEWRFRNLDGTYSGVKVVDGGQRSLSEVRRIAVSLSQETGGAPIVAENLSISAKRYGWVSNRHIFDGRGEFHYVDSTGNPVHP